MTFGLLMSPQLTMAQAPVGGPVGGGPGSSAPHCNRAWRPLAERPPCWLAVWGPEPALVAAWPHGSVSVGRSCPDVQCPDLRLREPGGLSPDCCLTVSPGVFRVWLSEILTSVPTPGFSIWMTLCHLGMPIPPSAPPSAGQAENFHP